MTGGRRPAAGGRRRARRGAAAFPLYGRHRAMPAPTFTWSVR
ncbi:hypothetical protein BVI434_2470036 [Burkholderia vietnamiensis]|nr:hypothetical protein BVI434_2470036 [Burkholderia vietnamiensis]